MLALSVDARATALKFATANESRFERKALGIITDSCAYLLRHHGLRAYSLAQVDEVGEVVEPSIMHGEEWKIESYYGQSVFVFTAPSGEQLVVKRVVRLVGQEEFFSD